MGPGKAHPHIILGPHLGVCVVRRVRPDDMLPQIYPLQDNGRIIRKDLLLGARGTSGYNYRVNAILYILCDELGAFFTAQEWMSLAYFNIIFLGGYFG